MAKYKVGDILWLTRAKSVTDKKVYVRITAVDNDKYSYQYLEPRDYAYPSYKTKMYIEHVDKASSIRLAPRAIEVIYG